MGGLLSALKDVFQSKVERRILIVGLDGAGKTTMLYKLKLAETGTSIVCQVHVVSTFAV
jgi:GTPase SAR1 family protein